ncbi:MAG: Exodeoxyribonuclease 7 large subunit, partial [Acidimicrobiales bacterium]|nr:Exodeoxyribonuclease 7 large subunit [Acidimicrobiales bacterium]
TERALDAVAAQVRAHDPQLALARGWTITTTADGRPAGRLAGLRVGDELVTRFADGHATSTITATTPDPPA